LPECEMCDSFIVVIVVGRLELSRVGGEPGGNDVRAAAVRHGDSGG
jgi:hypothetical protein